MVLLHLKTSRVYWSKNPVVNPVPRILLKQETPRRVHLFEAGNGRPQMDFATRCARARVEAQIPKNRYTLGSSTLNIDP